MSESLISLIESKEAVIGVVGLGYVGLPLIRAFTDSGFRAIGFDVDAKKVDLLKEGKTYIKHIMAEWVVDVIQTKKLFEPTADMSRMSEVDVILICVPTPLTQSRDPDLTYVVSTTSMVAKTLRPGQLVILESTTYPGTTRDVVFPILKEKGLEIGKDFFVAYSPEREDPGNPSYNAKNIPKVVGGMDETSALLARTLYDAAVSEVVVVANCEVAEACKILENTYRSVNIAMVNELKVLFQRLGLDVWDVIEAAKTKPFGFQAFYPGPGLGGHCIPIDPFYLSWVARKHEMPTRFIELAGEINTSMPHFVVSRVSDALNDHSKAVKSSKILILGVSYKKDVDDPRESPSFRLMELLRSKGACICFHDPHFPRLPAMRHYSLPPLESIEITPENIASQDCVLISTDHSTYDWETIVLHAKIVVDTRNATRNVQQHRNKIYKA